MKLTAKIILYILSFFALLLTALHFALIYILPLDNVKDKIAAEIEKNINAKVSINKISASLFHFSIRDVEITADGEKFAYIGSANIYFSLFHILKGQIKVLGINFDDFGINIVKDDQEHFNFEKLLIKSPPGQDSLEKEQEQTNKTINLILCKSHIQNGVINYTDKKNKMTVNVTQMSVYAQDFSFTDSFKLNASVQIDANLNNKQFDTLHLAFNSFVNLNSMDLAKAKIDIDNFVIKFKQTVAVLAGSIENFNSPQADITLKIKDLSENTFKDFVLAPEFFISEIDITSKITARLEQSTADIAFFNIRTLDSSIDINGMLDYGKKELLYNFNLSFDFLLKPLANAVKMIQEYKLNGSLKGKFTITDKNLIKGTCRFVDIGAFVPDLGYLTNINSDIEIKNINNMKMPKLTGNLNKNPFLMEAYYLTGKNSGDISLFFRANKIFGIITEEQPSKSDVPKQESFSKDETEQKTQKTKEQKRFIPLNIKTDCMIADIDVKFFKGTDIIFKTDLSGFTPVLDNIKGTLNFQSGKGTIKDLHKLTNSNALMKGLFLSLDVVSRVINALNILDILNSIGSAVFTSDSENAGTEAGSQSEQKQKLDGKMDFDSFITFLNIEEGKAVFEKCSFVSSLLSFKVTGNMNFKEDKLDMTVNTAPGRHDDDGIMPLTMKITGTTQEPSGSLSLLGSVSSIVSQSLLNNAVSDGLKKGFMSLLGLKKHDEKGNEIQDVNISTNTFTNSNTPAEAQK